MNKEGIKSIYVVVSPDGKVWSDSARISHDECRNQFVKEWMAPIKQHIDSHTCWQVWQCFERAKYKIEEIKTENINLK